MTTPLNVLKNSARHALNSMRVLGWPAWAGAGLLLVALLLAAWAWSLEMSTKRLPNASMAPSLPAGQATPRLNGSDQSVEFPGSASFVKDLERMFDLAQKAGLPIEAIDYGQDPNPKAGAMVRTLSIRSSAPYPVVKGFLASAFTEFPHAGLKEIRFDRQDPQSGINTIALNLALVYRLDTATPAVTVASEPALPASQAGRAY